MTFGQIYKKSRIWILLVVALLLPNIVQSNYWLQLLSLGGIYAIVSLSLNILIGYTGLFSVGHIAFFGIGAYTSAIMATRFGTPFLLNVVLSGIMAMVFGIVLGVPTLRLKGMYLGVATLAFGEIVYQVFLNWDDVTRGSKGILGVPVASILGYQFRTYRDFYYLVLIFLVLAIVLVHNLMRSRIGRALLSIRESEIAAEALGVNVVLYKVLSFATAAFFAGIAGALYCYELKCIFPESFTNSESSTVLAMMVVGGMGSIPGSILGGIVLTIIPEVLRFVGNIRLVLYGIAIVAIIVFAPKGMGGLIDWIDRKLMSIGTKKVKEQKEEQK
jgi:branched-chain amino acid transport system permease protein